MALPQRPDIDPADFPAPLQNIFLLNVHDGEPWFSYRVAGSKLSWLLRRPLTGQPLGTGLQEHHRRAAITRARDVALAQEPRFRSGDLGWCDRDYLDFEELLLPLAGPDGSTAMILGILMVLDPHGLEV
ncbi:PAS domain-containing protein [Skermanella pratensis]|uniref:PAS domain-containing protein n=1 Tax=Skermanella pratensis TaxID=2233999 RepID=UPI001FE3171C|nr:PAS domain-containing protein [Skermanella pratensis]